MNPLVSILIPCYNAEQWIGQAIDSALNQTYDNFEVIVIDDGSTDRSLEIIKSYGEHITWHTSKNCGGNATRNKLLKLSKGQWLQYLDADDYLLPGKIKRQIKFLTQNLGTDIVYSPIILQHHNYIVEATLNQRKQDQVASMAKVLNLEAPTDITQEILPIPQPHDPWILLARWYLPQTGSCLWRKESIISVGGWSEEQVCCQEHELYLRLLKHQKKFSYFSIGGSVYRQWSEATVCKQNKPETFRRRLEITDKIERHLTITNQLTKPRQDSINQARFECARVLWLTDKSWSTNIIRQIRQQDLNFVPTGNCAPEIYRLMYQFFGFNFAETLAVVKRGFSFASLFSLSLSGID